MTRYMYTTWNTFIKILNVFLLYYLILFKRTSRKVNCELCVEAMWYSGVYISFG